ncbi:hypothetical protein TNCV_414141 [Trichonephila clavipes]|nr:hypothetical protein TNCV_414141 [Trichonephila clavipes]
MKQVTKVASKIGKFTKNDTSTKEHLTMKCFHVCITINANAVHCVAACTVREEDRRGLSTQKNMSCNPSKKILTAAHELLLSSLSSVSLLDFARTRLRFLTILQEGSYYSVTIIPNMWNLYNGSGKEITWDSSFTASALF